MIKKTYSKNISLFDSLLLFILLVSLSSLSLLAINKFNSISAIIIGLFGVILIMGIFKYTIVFNYRNINIGLLLILLIALFFRPEPYLYVIGGQDQGTYVNMSSTYEKKGSTFIVDKVRSKIKDKELIRYYDQHNQLAVDMRQRHIKEGIHLLGIYIKKLNTSEYVYQFYPLHPLWMAMWGKIFGSDNRVGSLIFFSLLSIIAFYLIALEISGGSRIAAYTVSLFLALNPLHAFFSKFPVTEIMTLAFSCTSFYFLIKYYKNSTNGDNNPFYLFLSAGLISCLFFTRISGFMYIPFYYILLSATILFVEDRVTKKHLIAYFLSIFTLLGVSIIYGLHYSLPYSLDIYRKSFKSIFGQNWKDDLSLLITFLLALLLVLYFISSLKLKSINFIIKKVFLFFKNNLNYIFYAIILLGAYEAYKLVFIIKYSGGGLNSLFYANIVVASLYLSPFGFLLLLTGIGIKEIRKNPLSSSLIFFLIIFWIAFTLIQKITLYHYYFARYLVSELVPYSLLLISLILSYLHKRNIFSKLITYCFIGSISLYFVYFTSFQLLGKSADGTDKTLKKIVHQLDENDLLLMDKKNYWKYGEMKTALSFYYDLNVFSFNSLNDLPWIIENIAHSYNDFFILSQSTYNDDFFTLIDIINYKEGRFHHINNIPRRFSHMGKTLYLYRVNISQLKQDSFYISKLFYPQKKIKNLVNFHEDSLWTKGSSTIDSLRYKVDPLDQFLVLNTKGLHPYIEELEKINLKVYVNNEELKFSERDGKSFYFILSDKKEINKIKILSNTFTPKELGISNDTRQLGIDVDSIKIEQIKIFYPKNNSHKLKNFYRDWIWTNGQGLINDVNYKIRPGNTFFILNTNGWNPIRDNLKKLNLRIYVSDIELDFSHKEGNSFYFKLPKIDVIRMIRITSSTFVPIEYGINNDGRKLGIDVKSIDIR